MSAPLPEPLPDDPLPLVQRWLAEASQADPHAMSMALATVEPDGRPAARMVICRGFDPAAGWFVFYTDRESSKGQALRANPRSALVFYWDGLGRQVRVEGPVTLAPDTDSDAYWRMRPAEARIAAAASSQSQPIPNRAAFLAKVDEVARRFQGDIPRPERWGGYRVWVERLELWVSHPGRMHDRALWIRSLEPTGAGFRGGPWRSTRLQP
jgi:pyridoxamine 5'-phosphate oxidase